MGRRLDGGVAGAKVPALSVPARRAARLSLTVSPGAARSAVVGRHGAGWKVRVAAAAEDGKANAALVRLLADVLAVPVRAVAIVAGHTSRAKIVELSGLDYHEVERRLAVATAAGKEPR